MNNNGIIEVIEFDVDTTYDNETILRGFDLLSNYYLEQGGFYGLHNAQMSDKRWMLILKWQSKADEKQASANMMKSESTVDFKKLIIPTSVKKNIYSSYTLS